MTKHSLFWILITALAGALALGYVVRGVDIAAAFAVLIGIVAAAQAERAWK